MLLVCLHTSDAWRKLMPRLVLKSRPVVLGRIVTNLAAGCNQSAISL